MSFQLGPPTEGLPPLPYLILEMGVSIQPLQQSFADYNEWVTWGWLVSLWEKGDKFGIVVEFNDVSIAPPRRGDKWLMLLFKAAGYSVADLLSLICAPRPLFWSVRKDGGALLAVFPRGLLTHVRTGVNFSACWRYISFSLRRIKPTPHCRARR